MHNIKQVVKLMKTEDGNLVPVPEKPKQSELNHKMKVDEKRESAIKKREKNHLFTNTDEQVISVDLQLQNPPLSNSECPSLSSEFANLPVIDSVPQVLSLVDINTGQVLTVEVTNPESLSVNELTDQLGVNGNEMLNLDYKDIEFHSNFLNAGQTYYDSTNYSEEVSLENIEDSSSLMSNNIKIETIENYLTREFSSFFNL